MSDFHPYLPTDFDAFWRETVDEARSFPVDFARSGTNDFDWPGFKVETFTFAVLSNRRLNGWIAIPERELTRDSVPPRETPRANGRQAETIESSAPLVEVGKRSGAFETSRMSEAESRHQGEPNEGLPGAERPTPNTSMPAFLWIPPYGRESLLPNEYGTRQGFVSLSFNFFGEPAFHQEKYVKERGYFSEGAANPHTWIFRQMFQDAYIAFRVLQSQPEVDKNRVGLMGMSQGAGISIWLGAMCDGVKAVCADMAFLCAIKHTLTKTVHRYPLKELTDFMHATPDGVNRVLRTVAYFDTMNMATHCKVPTHMTIGLKDPAAKPDNVRAAYEGLAGEKEKLEIEWGHDWHPTMIETNRKWLLDHV